MFSPSRVKSRIHSGTAPRARISMTPTTRGPSAMKIEGSWASAGGFRRECNTAAATRASGIDTRADTFTQAGRGAPSALAPPDRRAEKSFRRAHGGRSGEAATTGPPARVRTGPSVPASDQGVLGFAPDWPGVEGIQERADGGLPFHCGGGPGISPRRCAGERGRRPRAARESTLLPPELLATRADGSGTRYGRSRGGPGGSPYRLQAPAQVPA